MKNKVLSAVIAAVMILSAFSLSVFAATEMKDGIYEVNIALWHSEDDKESMAADSVGENATIVVENGVRTMHITSGEMSMMGIKASLQELKIADSNGNYTDAKVESRDSEGNPTGFYFTLPHTNQYVTVKVNPHIALMGNKDIGARIKVDYSTLKLVQAAEDASSVTETETTVVQTPEGETVYVTQAIEEAAPEQSVHIQSEAEQTTQAAAEENDGEKAFLNKKTTLVIIFVLDVVVITAVLAVVAVKKKKK